jgi:cell division protease FtsH
VERLVAGLEKKNRLINPKEREIVAYHEMGHALVSFFLPGTDPVQKITIIPRGIAALGYTMQVPTEDRFLMKKTELLNRIATLLGGRAAEAIVFEDISTGAHNDLSKATDIARSMVREYGMSDKVGQVYFSPKNQSQFLNVPGMGGATEYSESTAEIIDAEIREILAAQYKIAVDILSDKKDLLEKCAAILLEKETLDGEELKKIIEAS